MDDEADEADGAEWLKSWGRENARGVEEKSGENWNGGLRDFWGGKCKRFFKIHQRKERKQKPYSSLQHDYLFEPHLWKFS